jgi:hypothetical protein
LFGACFIVFWDLFGAAYTAHRRLEPVVRNSKSQINSIFQIPDSKSLGLAEVAPRPYLFLQALPVEQNPQIPNHSGVAPMALLFVLNALFYHNVAPMALTPRLSPRVPRPAPCADVSRSCGRSKVGGAERGVAPTALLFEGDAFFYHSVAPMALIECWKKLHAFGEPGYHSVAPMALIECWKKLHAFGEPGKIPNPVSGWLR